VPNGIRLAPEAPIHIFRLSFIFFGLLSMGIFVNSPIDMQEIAVPVSNIYLQDNLKLFLRVIQSLAVFYV
jgi:hypothetical protein